MLYVWGLVELRACCSQDRNFSSGERGGSGEGEAEARHPGDGCGRCTVEGWGSDCGSEREAWRS